MQIGQMIEARLYELGKEKQDLAKALHRSSQVVTMILQGRREIKVRELPVLRRVLEWPEWDPYARKMPEEAADLNSAFEARLRRYMRLAFEKLGADEPGDAVEIVLEFAKGKSPLPDGTTAEVVLLGLLEQSRLKPDRTRAKRQTRPRS